VVPDPLGINDLNVATSITLSGTMTCPGGALDSSCFGLAVCPDFSTCDLTARSLTLDAGVPLTSLKVGAVGDGGTTTVEFGVSPGYFIDTFTMYGNTAQYNTNGAQSFATLNGDISMTAAGGITRSWTALSTGPASITAGLGLTLSNSGPANVLIINSGTNQDMTLSTTRELFATAPLMTVQAGTFTLLEGVADPWFATDPVNTLSCGTVVPLPVAPGKSIVFDDDIILAAGVNLMSASPDALVRVGGGISLCGVLIESSGPTLQLQGDTPTKVLDIRATIVNGQGGQPVIVSESDGFDFSDTPIGNTGGATLGTIAGAVYVSDPEGFETAADILGGNDITATGAINGATGTIGGTSFAAGGVITGVTMINGSPYVAGAGPCCTSDKRVKHQVTEVAPEEDLAYVLGLPKRISFKYNKDYQAVDKWVKDHVYHSFIAQEVEKHDPTLVHSVEQKVGSVTYKDLKKLALQKAVPRLVGAIKGIHASHMDLLEDHKDLKHAYAVLKDQVAGMEEKMVKLERALLH